MKRYKIKSEFGTFFTDDKIFADFMNNKKPSFWSRFIKWLFG